jgi:hypothetical protein
MPWKIGENIIAGQVSATPKQDPGVSRYTKPMPRNGLEPINSGASSCRYKYPRELRFMKSFQQLKRSIKRSMTRFVQYDMALS